MADVTVLVSTYNRAEQLRETLRALRAQRLGPGLSIELVIVDNRSSDHTAQVVREEGLTAPWPVRYLYEGRPGVSVARNRGIREAQGRWIAFTDDDARPSPDWIACLTRPLREDGVDGVCGRIRPQWEIVPPAWARRFGHGPLALVDYGDQPLAVTDGRHQFVSANMALAREVFARIGGFREDLGPAGSVPLRGDDTELFERALAAGCRLVYEPRAWVEHHIPAQRLTRRYFRRWNFWSGFSTARYRAPSLSGGRRLWGMAGWAVRDAAQAMVRALGLYAIGRWEDAFGCELRGWARIGYARGMVRQAAPSQAIASSDAHPLAHP